jgi:hypothetical protein
MSFVGACASMDLQISQYFLRFSQHSTSTTCRLFPGHISQLQQPTLLVRGWICCARLGWDGGILLFLESARNER